MNKILYFDMFFIGLGFGSFSSVLIHRIYHKEKGIFLGRSKCPKCQHKLDAIDLIPLFGFLINKGKCKYCHKKISIRYPVFELIMGLFFLLTTMLTGFDNITLLIYYLFLTFIFVLLSMYDIMYQEVADEISLPTIVITAIASFFITDFTTKNIIIGFLVPVLFFGTLFFASRGRWLGGGDIRIGAIMGFATVWPNILVSLFLAYLIGSIFSIFGIILGAIKRKSMIPFGPFLFLGTYISIFYGDSIINWYLHFM